MNIVSFSGGKDSTAMLLLMIEKGIAVDDIVFCDTGMEFPQMYDHIDKVEKTIQRKITFLKGNNTYEYFLGEHVKKNGKVGYGHPDFRNRWCTTLLKKAPFFKYINKLDNVVEYHGIAFDEKHRIEINNKKVRIINYPLVEWQITENQALDYCYSKGFDWGVFIKNLKDYPVGVVRYKGWVSYVSCIMIFQNSGLNLRGWIKNRLEDLGIIINWMN